jgi:penicillin-binding protein 1A
MEGYFQQARERYVLDYVKSELFKEYGTATVQRGGFKVYTTIDLKKQQAARAAIADKMGDVGPSSAVVTIDPTNGDIVTMASSGDYGKSNFNLAAQGHRQPGSVFKVITLMTALREGVNPETTHYTSVSPIELKDPPCGSAQSPWTVKTYGGKGAGDLSLVQATLKSDNSVYAQLASDLGPDKVKETARMMGITAPLHGYCAETLGGLSQGVSPLEVADAYATIADGGYRNRPRAIRKVVFADGHSELPARWKVKRTKVFPDGVTYEATKILKENVQAGTGTKANYGCPAGGKTGTTSDIKDAWFVGFTPRLSTAVWMGYKTPVYMVVHGSSVQGGTFPAPIWHDYMQVASDGYCGSDWPEGGTFESEPFFGRYSSTGSDDDENYSYDGSSDGSSDGTTTDGTTDGTTGTDGGTTGATGNDGANSNPDAYARPPQGEPDIQTEGGGAGVPGGN